MGLLTRLSDWGEYVISGGKRPLVEQAARELWGVPDSQVSELLPPGYKPYREKLRTWKVNERQNPDGSWEWDEYSLWRNNYDSAEWSAGTEYEVFNGHVHLK